MSSACTNSGREIGRHRGILHGLLNSIFHLTLLSFHTVDPILPLLYHVYLSTYCSVLVLAVHEQYSHFLKLYIMKGILSWWYCIVQAYGDGYA